MLRRKSSNAYAQVGRPAPDKDAIGAELINTGDPIGTPAPEEEMKELMQTPEAMKTWFETKRKEFDALPHNG